MFYDGLFVFAEPKRARRIRDHERMREASYRVARLTRRVMHNFPDTKADPSGHTYRTRDGYTRHVQVAVPWEEADRDRRSYAAFHAQNMAKCSCDMCGNPRNRWGTLTRQEMRACDDAAEQMKDGV